MPLLIHGDAAFAGQGVVAECFGLSGLKGYRTGGSLHFIVNNQIGFTTYPRYSRSSPYPSDVAKMIEAPIFHVNGDDPEAVVFAAKVATEFRQRFQQAGRHRHVLLSPLRPQRRRRAGVHPAADVQEHPLACDRRWRSTPGSSIGEGVVTEGEVDKMKADWRSRLDAEHEAGTGLQAEQGRLARRPLGRHEGRRRQSTIRAAATPASTLPIRCATSARRSPRCRTDFHVHSTIQRFLDNRPQGDRDRRGHRLGDRRGARVLHACSLDGHRVRLSGQDCERGTFSSAPLGAVRSGERGALHAVQSHRARSRRATRSSTRCSRKRPCSATSTATRLAEPNALTLWEAQFGDFANGAQVVFDQFISSGERKWLRMSGLVCLLPHGYEGQGPEHSSARLERFLQMCAEDNMQVANCTTPANYFHILRRQLKREIRKPLILMTPKSLLRHKRAVSRLDELGPDYDLPSPAVGRRADPTATRRSSSSPTTRSAA